MGLFDYIYYEGELLGVKIEDPTAVIHNYPAFQTKSLYRTMETYKITKEGRLLKENFNEDREFAGWKDVGFHGILCFYNAFDLPNFHSRWLEFEARFDFGQLDEIKLIKDKVTDQTEHHLALQKFLEEEKANHKRKIYYKLKKWKNGVLYFLIRGLQRLY